MAAVIRAVRETAMKRAVTKPPNHQSIQRIPQSAGGQRRRGRSPDTGIAHAASPNCRIEVSGTAQRRLGQGWSGTTHVSPGTDRGAIVRSSWALEIYRGGMCQNFLIAMHEFDDFASLRAKIVENRACRFLIDPPAQATSREFQCLLDLRGRGFKIRRK
jgi:hypothetical protein